MLNLPFLPTRTCHCIYSSTSQPGSSFRRPASIWSPCTVYAWPEHLGTVRINVGLLKPRCHLGWALAYLHVHNVVVDPELVLLQHLKKGLHGLRGGEEL